VIFGQTPYPRVESATGIAMFDNAFHSWQEPRFPQCLSMRNMLKTALIWKHGLPETLPAKQVPVLLQQHGVVPPPEWFQAMLSQGVLLVDASLTRHADDAVPVAKHVAFWAPVAEAIVAAIVAAKQTAPPEHRGVVFAWWGAHARELKLAVTKLAAGYPDVPVRHLDHWHPASRDNRFCEGGHYQQLNDALVELGASPIDWLPTPGWKDRVERASGSAGASTVDQMGAFISHTMDLHKLFLERLQGAADEKMEELPAIEGVMASPLQSLAAAAEPVVEILPAVKSFVAAALAYAAGRPVTNGLSTDDVAALYLYTTESPLYRQMNAALRDQDRSRVAPYYAYLRLFLNALSRLEGRSDGLYRGVKADLRGRYAPGSTVTWWGVSSCTPKLSVAQAFLGAAGRRTLFEIAPRAAIGIRSYSAFTGEEEFILPPGARLEVLEATHETGGLSTIKLREVADKRLFA
jgi:uracil DNA glycosylase